MGKFSLLRRQSRALPPLLFVLLVAYSTSAQIPEWCKPLPRPEYAQLKRLLPDDPWFEVYKVAPGTFAIYEPQQSEKEIRGIQSFHRDPAAILKGTPKGFRYARNS
jgi:hypothetical protein